MLKILKHVNVKVVVFEIWRKSCIKIYSDTNSESIAKILTLPSPALLTWKKLALNFAEKGIFNRHLLGIEKFSCRLNFFRVRKLVGC